MSEKSRTFVIQGEAQMTIRKLAVLVPCPDEMLRASLNYAPWHFGAPLVDNAPIEEADTPLIVEKPQ